MRTIIILTISLLSIVGMAQNKYQQGMTKAFELWQQDKPWEAANMFERIASVETDNWLPAFYVAQINVLYSFNEKDKDKLTAQLTKAQNFLNDAKALTSDNAEIPLLQAQLYSAWVVFDGQTYGMQYAQKIGELYGDAQSLDPTNPRAAFGKVEWDMGTAQFFGQPVEPFCEKMQAALELFANFKPAGEFYPQGGEEYARSAAEARCNQ
ncbi:hypothetical protein [Aureitalea marina]|uniref:Tetratricopeptide repeat protein n=1 Tax=Aureitalea marina TaxID=930804 RepID=A0A2S7KPV7_9FLAO|nr:hypothetical protein [Aureitalea marina]PQB04637.1 hypothetical protein BST85_06805 [Aureitalea marina]